MTKVLCPKCQTQPILTITPGSERKVNNFMRTWNNNGYVINEVDFNYDLHAFEVYKNDKLLGSVYPDDIADMESCIRALDNGEDPVTDKWEDGCGNSCAEDGWGE